MRSREPGRRFRADAAVGWLGAAVVVVAVYAVVVRGGGALIGQTSSPHLGLSVLATAVVALTVEPARLRVERLANRFLLGGRLSPYEILAEFGRQVNAPAREELPVRMARLLAEGTGATWAQVWLLVNDRLRLVAAYPADVATRLDAPPLLGNELREGLKSVPVGHGGVLLGVLRVQEREGSGLTPVEQRLFAGLAAQAGLALHNARLRAELTARHHELTRRAAELREARDQLVDAQDQERRRLERDIHDGAQQQLVALGINLRLARALSERAPEQATRVLVEQADAAADAIATLATLSRGVEPPILREHGLAEALAAAAATSPIPARVRAPDVGRFSRAVESALYFCCLEALQNAAKHSGAQAVEIGLDLDRDCLRLTVTDDGAGLPDDIRPGTGLTNMRDRVAGLGGHLDIDSRPGGTTVTAVVPALRVPAQRTG